MQTTKTSSKEGGNMSQTVFEMLRQEGIEIGVKEGKEIGVKEGMKEGMEITKMRTVINCIKKKMDTLTIAEISELPVEKIESIRNAFLQGTLSFQ